MRAATKELPMPAKELPVPTGANQRVAAVFDEIADLLEVQGGNGFRVRAYRTALRGIGKDLAAKIVEISSSGSCAQLETLRHGTPAGVAELLQLPGLGPRRVQSLHDRLGIGSLTDLQAAAQ